VLGEHDGGCGAGRGDQEAGVGERGGHVASPQRPAVDRRGCLGGTLLATAGHPQPPDPGLGQQPGRELARAAGANDNRVAGGEPAQVRGGEVQAGPGEGDAFGADRGLGAGPLAGPQRRVDQAGDDRSGGSRRRGRAGRILDLGDDLILTDGHRIQPARDREQVLGGRAADPDASQPQDLAGLNPPMGRQHVRDRPGHRSGRAARSRIDLDPVAGRQDDRLGDGRHGTQPGQHTAALCGRNS